MFAVEIFSCGSLEAEVNVIMWAVASQSLRLLWDVIVLVLKLELEIQWPEARIRSLASQRTLAI